MKRILSMFFIASLLAAAPLACNPNNDPNNNNGDPATACTDLCTTSGFTSGRAEVYPHELNCFCEGGAASAQVTAAACTETCTDLGWSAGNAFSTSACQCD
ncbi:MAG TPA: hypothetical protein VF815_18240 [Myxococcaceae bacterium]|jgi:hypothetical protein